MSHIQYIIYLFFTFVSFSYSQSNLNIALFNFNNSQIDQRNEVAVNLSDKIINSFIKCVIFPYVIYNKDFIKKK